MSDPLGQVQRIYEDADIELDGEARGAMAAWLSEDAREKLPAHRYTAADFGLSEREIRAEFSRYTARFIAPHRS